MRVTGLSLVEWVLGFFLFGVYVGVDVGLFMGVVRVLL